MSAEMERIVNSLPKWVRKDIAIEVLSEVMADKRREIMSEEDQPNPDQDKIQRLEDELAILSEERKEMYMGNQEVIQKILVEYGAIVRQKYMGDN
jgi:hypothetical protein